MIAIFAEMGFGLAEGPDIEDDFHNFTALNFPPKHPAREMHDTFWLPEDERRRAQGAAHPHQPRADPHHAAGPNDKLPSLDRHQPGRRRSASSCPAAPTAPTSDATHTPMFHQMEGLVIDRAIHMGHLKWTLETFIAPLLRDAAGGDPLPPAPLPVHRALGRDGRAAATAPAAT